MYQLRDRERFEQGLDSKYGMPEDDVEDAMDIEYVDLETNGSATLYIDEEEDE